MRFILRLRIPNDAGNAALKDPQFGAKMQKVLADMKAEAAYFPPVDGCRGGYIILNLDDASQIPAIAEPLFLWLNAEIDLHPVMTPQDLGKAGPAIAAAVQQWG